MGLKCPKCGTDNLLTAIFCRGCGDKLDLEAMKPEAILNDEHTKNQLQGPSKLEKTFVGVVFGLLGIMLLLAICPVGAKGTDGSEPDKETAKVFELVNKTKVLPKVEESSEQGSSGPALSGEVTSAWCWKVPRTLEELRKEGQPGGRLYDVRSKLETAMGKMALDFRPECEFVPVKGVMGQGFMTIDPNRPVMQCKYHLGHVILERDLEY